MIIGVVSENVVSGEIRNKAGCCPVSGTPSVVSSSTSM